MKIKHFERKLKGISKIVFKITDRKSVEFVTDILFDSKQIEFNGKRGYFVGLESRRNYLNYRIKDYYKAIALIYKLQKRESGNTSLTEIKKIIKRFLKNGTINLLFDICDNYFMSVGYPNENHDNFYSSIINEYFYLEDFSNNLKISHILELSDYFIPRFTYNFIVKHDKRIALQITYKRTSTRIYSDTFLSEYMTWDPRKNRFIGGKSSDVYNFNMLIIKIENLLEKYQYLFSLRTMEPDIKEIRKNFPFWIFGGGITLSFLDKLEKELDDEINELQG